MTTPLDDHAIREALALLPGWRHEGGALVREVRLQTFSEALALLVRIGIEAERMDHHPELFNVYNRVRITLRTHDAGDRVTGLDVELASKISSLLPE
jgi:4a-hydroxytetrahydrobiopterin dehydratase